MEGFTFRRRSDPSVDSRTDSPIDESHITRDVDVDDARNV